MTGNLLTVRGAGNAPTERNRPSYADVLKLFASAAKATIFAKKFGLNAGTEKL